MNNDIKLYTYASRKNHVWDEITPYMEKKIFRSAIDVVQYLTI